MIKNKISIYDSLVLKSSYIYLMTIIKFKIQSDNKKKFSFFTYK